MNSKGKLEQLKAYHEAGHAVVARTLGIAMSYVTTLPPEGVNAGGARPTVRAGFPRSR